VVGDIADHRAVHDAAEGMDAIVHLAATTDDAPFLDKLLQPNVVGLFNVMDAARAGSARRVVLASSMQVLSGLRHEERIKTADDAAPTNHYALTKVWAEAMGEMYARCYGLSVIAARIGWMTRNKREAQKLDHHHAHDSYLSPRDTGRFFAAAVEAEVAGFHILYAVSRPRDRVRVDLETAKRVIGYEPLDAFPEGLDFPWP
jgi:uronate dehydrogenase